MVSKLESLTRDQLRKEASSLGIKGYGKLKKAELLQAVQQHYSDLVVTPEQQAVVEQVGFKQQQEKAKPCADREPIVVTIRGVASSAIEDKVLERRMGYIDKCEIGDLIAFDDGRRVRAAKMINRAAKSQKLMLETDYGQRYVVPYTSVIWVKTGDRWPEGVHQLLIAHNLQKKEGVRNEKTKAS